ncbi:MAG: IS1380 family transposase [Bryobacteraceae bacterium]
MHALLGVKRFPSDDTIRNLFRRFGMGEVHQLYGPLMEIPMGLRATKADERPQARNRAATARERSSACFSEEWQIERLPRRVEGYSLDLDSTVFERYGQQEGSLKGHNPRKHDRPSHHPLLAVLAEAHFLLHGWLRRGNCGPARGVVEFLKEALALWQQRQTIRVVRADSGFFDDELLSFLEQRRLPYIVVARMTKWVQRAAQRVEQWQSLDENYALGEFYLQLWGWKTERRSIAVRECVRESRPSVGRKLIDVPGYTFRILVTSQTQPAEEVWRDYNRRADVENRIAELKHDLGADGFCLQKFFATEAAFRAVLLVFNLLAEFQRATGLPGYREPATLRTQVLTCGAILGRAGRRLGRQTAPVRGRMLSAARMYIERI